MAVAENVVVVRPVPGEVERGILENGDQIGQPKGMDKGGSS